MTNILPYVYKLTHKITRQFYIGYRCANRSPALLDLGVKYFTSSKYIKELGFENFETEIIAEFFNKSDALEFETFLIKENWKHPLSLNKNLGGIKFTTLGISIKGKVRTEEHQAKINASKKIHYEKFGVSQDTRDKISFANTGKVSWLGLKHSDETKAKLSHHAKNRTEEHKAKLSEALKGRALSDDCKIKISIALKGKKRSPETKERMSKAFSGRVYSQETIEKGKATRKANGYECTEETRKKLSVAAKGRIFSDEHKKAKSVAQMGSNNPQGNTWTLERDTGEIIVVKTNFKNYCKENNLKTNKLISSLSTGIFVDGLRLISKVRTHKPKPKLF